MLSISIVIPTYNEEKRVGKTLKKIMHYLNSKKYDYEIIVVDDGSSDNTISVLKKFKNSKLKVIANKINHGKGYVVKQGMLAAKKDLILFTDADLSTPIEELANFKKYLNYDILIGSRNLKESNIKSKQPFYRIFFGKIFSLLVKFLAVRGIKDTQCGFKLFKKDVAKKIFTKQTIGRFGFDVEILYLAKKYGYKIKELPVEWLNDEQSKVRVFTDSKKMLIDILRIRINDLKGKY